MEKTKVYGVFLKDILIFSDVMSYAIYEKKKFAESYMRELQGYYPDAVYTVRKIYLDVEITHGNVEGQK